jgi:hypothetical protein
MPEYLVLTHASPILYGSLCQPSCEPGPGSGLGPEIHLGFPVRAYCSLDGSLAISE